MYSITENFFAVKAVPMEKVVVPFSDIVDEFLDARSLDLSPNTIAEYRITLLRAVEFFGKDRDMETIAPRDIRHFLAHIPGGKKTKKNAHIGLSSLWTWSIKNHYASEHVVRAVNVPTAPQKDIHPYTEDEIKAMFETLGGRTTVRDRALLLFLLDTGVRASELANVMTSNVRGTTVDIPHGKGDKPRSVIISLTTLEAVLKYQQETRPTSPCRNLFLTFDGKAMDRDSIRLLISRIGSRAGVEGAHPHRFRHTFAINYLANGGDAYTLQEILGHSTMEMVKRYLEITSSLIQKVHRRASPVENWGLGDIRKDENKPKITRVEESVSV